MLLVKMGDDFAVRSGPELVTFCLLAKDMLIFVFFLLLFFPLICPFAPLQHSLPPSYLR